MLVGVYVEAVPTARSPAKDQNRRAGRLLTWVHVPLAGSHELRCWSFSSFVGPISRVAVIGDLGATATGGCARQRGPGACGVASSRPQRKPGNGGRCAL